MTKWSGKITVGIDSDGEEMTLHAYNLIINSPQCPTIPAPSLDSADRPANKYNPSYQMLLLQPYLQARTLAFTANGTLPSQPYLRFTMLGNPHEKAAEAENCLKVYARYLAWYNISTRPRPDNIEDIGRLYEKERARIFLELYASMVYGKKYFGVKFSGRERWCLARDGSGNRW